MKRKENQPVIGVRYMANFTDWGNPIDVLEISKETEKTIVIAKSGNSYRKETLDHMVFKTFEEAKVALIDRMRRKIEYAELSLERKINSLKRAENLTEDEAKEKTGNWC